MLYGEGTLRAQKNKQLNTVPVDGNRFSNTVQYTCSGGIRGQSKRYRDHVTRLNSNSATSFSYD